MSSSNKQNKNTSENIAPIFQWAGALSKLQKLFACVVTFSLIGAGFYFFIFEPKTNELDKLNKTLKTKKQTLVRYKAQAQALAGLLKQLEDLKVELNYAMAALPDEKEIPILLTEISRAGQKAGLQFLSFRPKAETIRDGFYAVIPVDMRVIGRFHQIARFFDEVSRLYRIVNIQRISIQKNGGGETLTISCNAVTYRFVNKKKKGKK